MLKSEVITLNNANEEKIKAMREHILHECRQQGFTLYEMQRLIMDLESDLMRRQQECCDKELF